MLYQRIWAQIDGEEIAQNRMVCDDKERRFCEIIDRHLSI